jgi:glyoxylase I family protein
MDAHRFSHIGICVSDLERSLLFYRDALGFVEVSRLEMKGAVTERLLDIPGGEIQAVYLKLGATLIELLFYPYAGHQSAASPRPMNKLGLTHLSLVVADLSNVAMAVEHSGGTLLDQTRIEHDGVTMAMFILDPDGMRIELVKASDKPSTVPDS